MTAPLLEVIDVRYRHPGAPEEAVRGISLRVAPGEIVALVGPNAAGKSTLARIAASLIRPTAGAVRLRGDEANALDRRERARRVAFLAQDEPADLPFTAREVALMGRAPHLGLWALETKADRARADGALAEMDASRLADRSVAHLSGGERRRVYLARTFAQDAALLVLDEPTDALDLKHQARLVAALRRRASAGGAALVVLHDLGLAAAACDRVALLDAGRLAAEGTPADVLRPNLLERIYGTEVDVISHPVTGRPLVSPRL
jgi:iron complex transport system ATP-binding protein